MRTATIVCGAALAATLAAPIPGQREAEKAAAELAKAEKFVADSKYTVAVARYKQIAKKYPNTPAGRIAKSRTAETCYLGWGDLQRHGPSSNRVDVVVMGDGYRLNDQNDFEDVAKSVVDVFRQHKVLGEYFSYHNFLRANLRSKDHGVTGYGRNKDTAIGGRITGAVQGQVGVDRGKCMQMLAQMPEQDGLCVAIVKAGSMGTGGGGVAAVGGRADKTMVHEWGHAFAGLQDEYTTFTGHRGSVRSNINIANTDDPEKVPWRHWIEAKAPGIGVYRGGSGRIKGAWKPTAGGCAMEGGMIFCEVCREALVLNMYRYVDPIESCKPDPKTSKTMRNGVEKPLSGRGPFSFEVEVMKPKTHNLEVAWWILPMDDSVDTTPRTWLPDRRKRGKLKPIEGSPHRRSRNTKTRHVLKIGKGQLEPGVYQVVCRVRDDAKPSGQQWPWVLKDDRDLLISERAWWVEIK